MYELQTALAVTGFLLLIVGGVVLCFAIDYRNATFRWLSGCSFALGLLSLLACAWVPVFA